MTKTLRNEFHKLIEEQADRIKKLEAFIIETRGELPGPRAFERKTVKAISDMLPEIKAFADSVRRGTGSTRNYEYQYRHAEHRAKMVKENLRVARKMMAAMIVSVASIADRTANSVNPEDIHHLRNELDGLSGYQQVMKYIEADTFLDGRMSELNLIEGTGRAGMNKPFRPNKGRAMPLMKPSQT